MATESEPCVLAVEDADVADADIVETRSLASIQSIKLLNAIPNKDLIVTARVLGYTVIVKKTDFPAIMTNGGSELCIFFEPDSRLDPRNPDLAFLADCKWRIRTIKMCGVYSQGLALPLSFLTHYGVDPASVCEGQNVTEAMRVRKFITEEERAQYCKGKFSLDPSIRLPLPSAITPTDEVNVQKAPHLFRRLLEAKVPVTITEKIDGCSATYWGPGQWGTGVASRNYQLVSDKGKDMEHYFAIDVQYNLRKLMAVKYPDLAIRGEISGPSINHNRLGLSQIQFQVFNVWHWKEGRYLPWDQVKLIAADLGVPVVPILFEGLPLQECGFSTWEDLMTFVNERKYANGSWSEGAVCKGMVGDEFISFKIVSQKYLEAIAKKNGKPAWVEKKIQRNKRSRGKDPKKPQRPPPAADAEKNVAS